MARAGFVFRVASRRAFLLLLLFLYYCCLLKAYHWEVWICLLSLRASENKERAAPPRASTSLGVATASSACLCSNPYTQKQSERHIIKRFFFIVGNKTDRAGTTCDEEMAAMDEQIAPSEFAFETGDDDDRYGGDDDDDNQTLSVGRTAASLASSEWNE